MCTQDGRLTTEASTPSGGGELSTLGYTHTPSDALESITLDGATIATPAYNPAGELTGVTHGNSTSGTSPAMEMAGYSDTAATSGSGPTGSITLAGRNGNR